MKYSSYERLFFPVTEVMFLVNRDLVKQKNNPSSKLNLCYLVFKHSREASLSQVFAVFKVSAMYQNIYI